MPDEGSNRRSNAVSLTVLGLVATVFIADKAIPQSTEMRRNLYANRADCERDYPPPPNRCDQDNGGSNSTGGGHGGSFHGPYYNATRSVAAADDPGPGRTGATRISYETSYRGGFGAIGRTIHAVG
jgi:hypothetical protein